MFLVAADSFRDRARIVVRFFVRVFLLFVVFAARLTISRRVGRRRFQQVFPFGIALLVDALRTY